MTLHSSVISVVAYVYNVVTGDSIILKQYEALRQFYVSTKMYSEASSRRHNWSFGNETGESAYCNFTGIACDQNGLVTTLELNSTFLAGTLPDVFESFPSLRRIRLFNNSIQGTMPDSLLRSSTLELLNLGQNVLSGTFPSVISPTIYRFSVHRNAIGGTIPSSLCSMTNLVVLDISQLTRMRGSIPDCFGELTALEAFRLTNIGLTGTVPAELCTERNMNGLIPNLFGCDAIACPSGTFQRAVGRQTKDETPCIQCDVPSNVIGSTTCQWHDSIVPTVSPSTEETFPGSVAPTFLQTTYPSNVNESPSPSPTIVLQTTTSPLPSESPSFSTFGPSSTVSSPPSIVNESPSDGRILNTGSVTAVSLLTIAFVSLITLLLVWRRRSLLPGHKRLPDETSSDLETPSVHESIAGDDLFSRDHRTTRVVRVESSEFNVADEDSLNVGRHITTLKADRATGLDVLSTVEAAKQLPAQPRTPSSFLQKVESPRIKKSQEDYPSTRKVRFSLPQPYSISVPSSTDVHQGMVTSTNISTNADNEAWLARLLNPLLNPITSCGVPCRDVSKTDHETASAISLDSGFSSLSALFAMHGSFSMRQMKSEIPPKRNSLEIDTVLGIRDLKTLKDDGSIISPIDSDVAMVQNDTIFRKHTESDCRVGRDMEWINTSSTDDLMYGDGVGRI
jgi:hypothetical protein